MVKPLNKRGFLFEKWFNLHEFIFLYCSIPISSFIFFIINIWPFAYWEIHSFIFLFLNLSYIFVLQSFFFYKINFSNNYQIFCLIFICYDKKDMMQTHEVVKINKENKHFFSAYRKRKFSHPSKHLLQWNDSHTYSNTFYIQNHFHKNSIDTF